MNYIYTTYNKHNLLSAHISSDELECFQTSFNFNPNKSIPKFFDECQKLDAFDKQYSSQLSSVARESIMNTLSSSYSQIVQYYCTQSQIQPANLPEEEWKVFRTSLAFSIKHPYNHHVMEIIETFCISFVYAVDVPVERKVHILDMLVHLAPSQEEQLAYMNQIDMLLLRTQEQPQKKLTKYDIETDKQNVHSTILNTIFRRKLLYLQQHHKIEHTFEEYCKILTLPAAKRPLQHKMPQSRISQARPATPYHPQRRPPPPPPSRALKEAPKRSLGQRIKDYFCDLKNRLFPSKQPQKDSQKDNELVMNLDRGLRKVQNDENKVVPPSEPPITIVYDVYAEEEKKEEQKLSEIDERLEKALLHITTCPIQIAPTTLRLRDIFCLVIERSLLVRNKPELFEEVVERCKQELMDSVGECSTGYCTRLLNVLSGFPDIDIEVVDFYVDEMVNELRAWFEAEVTDETLQESYISFDDERQPFYEYCEKNKMNWKTKLKEEYVKIKQTHSLFLFEEDFSEAYAKFKS